MSKNKTIYIAGPFFNPQQIEWIEKIKEVIIESGRLYYSPKDVNLFENGKGFDPEAIFQENIRAIKDCYAVVALTNDKDQGTHWEMGFAHALDIPVIAIWVSGDKNAKFNLMLSQSCIATFTNFYDLLEYLKQDSLTKKDYDGLLE